MNTDSDIIIVIAGSLANGNPAPRIVRELLGLDIRSISCGSRHICVLTSTGQLYSWGDGDYGKLGHGDRTIHMRPRLLELSIAVPFAQVGCGTSHTGAVSIDGELYTWGEGAYGKLGLGHAKNWPYPCLVEGLHAEKAKSFHAGYWHSCVLTESGQVYSFGYSGCTGHGGTEADLVPRQLDTFIQHPVVYIAIGSGGFHTLVLTADGKVFAWGDNRAGQLGLSDKSSKVQLPREVPDLPANITQLAAGTRHSCLLTGDGDVYVCGSNEVGQLGQDTSGYLDNCAGQGSFIILLQPLLQDKPVLEVACGAHHTMLRSNIGDVNGMGDNECRQVDASNIDSSITTPSKVHCLVDYFQNHKLEVLQMSCGMGFSAFVLGSRAPASLRKLCSMLIRRHAELKHLVLGDASAEEFMQQGISHDYAEIVRSMLV